jgi:hypothetical protein
MRLISVLIQRLQLWNISDGANRVMGTLNVLPNCSEVALVVHRLLDCLGLSVPVPDCVPAYRIAMCAQKRANCALLTHFRTLKVGCQSAQVFECFLLFVLQAFHPFPRCEKYVANSIS